MNLRPALRAFAEASHSSLYSPIVLVNRRSSLLQPQSLSLQNSDPCRCCSLDSRPLSWFSNFHSSSFYRRSRFRRVSVRVAVDLTSNFGSSCDTGVSSQSSSASGNFRPSAFPPSAMSLSSDLSLQSLSLQNLDPQPGDSRAADDTGKEDVLVQYIVIRKDLVSEQNWPLGSIISQGCHAAVAAIWLYRDDPETALYCRPENLDRMHKVTLEVKGETQLRNLAQKLETAGIAHKLWIEQPENYATCLATKPYHKSQVSTHFKKLKLCK